MAVDLAYDFFLCCYGFFYWPSNSLLILRGAKGILGKFRGRGTAAGE
jgi:hypothetical protein